MKSNKIYYVYCIYDEQKIPRYVGKGTKDRVKSHFTKKGSNELLNSFINENYSYEILVKNVSEQDAYIREIFYIKKFGRLDKSTGTLFNKTDGGEGYGRTGFVYDETSVKVYKHRRVFDLENIKTGQILHFESLGLAAKYLNTTAQNISCLLHGKNMYVNNEWKLANTTPIHKNGNSFTIKNFKTHKIHHFNSQQECAEFIGVDENYIVHLKTKKINHIKGIWVLPETNELIIKKRGTQKGQSAPYLYKKCKVYDNLHKEWLFFESRKEFSIKCKVFSGDVCNLLKRKIKALKENRFSLEPLNVGGRIYDNLDKRWIYFFNRKELWSICDCNKNKIDSLFGGYSKLMNKRYSLEPV
jgi:hypothetical protein